MIVEYADFYRREDRSRYIAERFRPYLHGKVLDVGCDRAMLKDLVAGIKYTGIDIGGQPDLQLDLEKIDRLPFEDGSFDCVVCSDVLEHLDNLHAIFDEIVRVAGRYVVISWPNSWASARVPISRGHASFKHYGLPTVRPPDRHKWFFSLTEANDFVNRKVAERGGMSVRDRVYTEKPRHVLCRMARRLRFPDRERYLNRYAHTLWTVIAKDAAEAGAPTEHA